MPDDTRSRILEAAGPIFARAGFEGATVREICDAAESNVASVNYHFGDKRTLYIETIKHAHARRIEQTPLPPWSAEIPPEQQLRAFIRMQLTRMLAARETPWEVQLMMREMSQPTGACQAVVEEFIRPEFTRLCGILSDLADESLPAETVARIAFSVVGQCLFYKVGYPVVPLLLGESMAETVTEIEPLVEHITRFSLAAISSDTLIGDSTESQTNGPHPDPSPVGS